jgi:hypothetical protein
MVGQSFDVVLQLERVSGVRKLTQIGRFGQGLKISEVAA